jgi:hypothetical protein
MNTFVSGESDAKGFFFGPILQLTRQLWRSVARDIFNQNNNILL